MQFVLDLFPCVYETLGAPRSRPSALNLFKFVVLYIVIISINKQDVIVGGYIVNWYRYLKTVENTKYDATLQKILEILGKGTISISL